MSCVLNRQLTLTVTSMQVRSTLTCFYLVLTLSKLSSYHFQFSFHSCFFCVLFNWAMIDKDAQIILTKREREFKEFLFGNSKCIKACSDRLHKTHRKVAFSFACVKCSELETIVSSVFYAANYAGLNKALKYLQYVLLRQSIAIDREKFQSLKQEQRKHLSSMFSFSLHHSLGMQLPVPNLIKPLRS